jgi:hypothetical protein
MQTMNELRRLARLSILAFGALCAQAAANPAAAPDPAPPSLPARRPGLWRITTIAPELGMRRSAVCIGSGDSIVGPRDGDCAEPSVSRADEQIIVTIECRRGEEREVTSLLFTGDYRNWYRTQAKTTRIDPRSRERRSGFTVEGLFLAPDCGSQGPR